MDLSLLITETLKFELSFTFFVLLVFFNRISV